MWLVIETSGGICGTLTYLIVLVVQLMFLRVGIWEGLQMGTQSAYLNFIVFQYHCCLIFWSHMKCMTSEPGILPKDYEELDFSKVSAEMKQAILAVKAEALKQDELMG